MDERRAEEAVRRITEIIEEIAQGDCPVVGYFTFVPVEGKPSKTWSIHWGTEIDDLFGMPDYKVAQILSVLGSEVRLAILRELIQKPLTAAELVDTLKMQTTGQAYHHLKDLQRASYIEPRAGGRFHVNMKVARIYIAALALAANAGGLIPERSAPDIEK